MQRSFLRKERTGWLVDHPVCAFAVASLHFLDSAATPPFQGGEYPSRHSRRPKTQNVSFNPSCITRELPEPTSGLPAATSGVAPPLPNPPGLEGSQPSWEPFAEPYG